MTSFIKKLYNRDPEAAMAFYEQAKRMPGAPVATFSDAYHRTQPAFGKRPVVLARNTACAASCGHPRCAHGCTRWGKHDFD